MQGKIQSGTASPFAVDESLVKSLQEMFPRVTPALIRSTLANHKGNNEKAVEELLNIDFIRSSSAPSGPKLAASLNQNIHTYSPQSQPQSSSVGSYGALPSKKETNPQPQPISISTSPKTSPTLEPLLNGANKPKITHSNSTTSINPKTSSTSETSKPVTSTSPRDNPKSDGKLGKFKQFVGGFLKNEKEEPNKASISPLQNSQEFATNSALDLIKILIDEGAAVNGFDEKEKTPLIVCLESRQTDAAKMLLEQFRADANKSNSTSSPLHIATKLGFLDMVQILLDKNAYVGRVDAETGKTALHMAVELRNYDIVSLLLEKGADLESRVFSTGDTALHIALKVASSTVDFMVIHLLLDKMQANPRTLQIKNNDGNTALHTAVQKLELASIVEKLLSIGADPVLRNTAGKTALQLAMECKNQIAIEKLKNPPLFAPKNTPQPQHSQSQTHPDDEEKLILKKKDTKPPIPLQQITIPHKSNFIPAVPTNGSQQSNAFFLSTPIPKSPRAVKDAELLPKPGQVHATSPSENHYSTIDVNLVKQAVEANMDPDYFILFQFKKRVEECLLNPATMEAEFEEIEKETGNANLTGDFQSALQPFNFKKNRYKNILPFEHSRVKMQAIDGVDGSEFFSGNYLYGGIEGVEKNLYIATQGPLESTITDFWRVVWEHQVSVIAMLAREYEGNKEKVFRYWPEQHNMPEQFGDFYVTLEEQNTENTQQSSEELVLRKISLQSLSLNTKRIVFQVQYTAWPDQGLPSSTKSFNSILDIVDSQNSPKKAPVLVHCSAGIGRTGVFFAVHDNVQKMRHILISQLASPSLNFSVPNTVRYMRQNRAGCVQTKEQYAFIYMSLKEKIDHYLALLSYKNEGFFHKSLDMDGAQAVLCKKPHGTFLFRYGKDRGTLCLSTVDGNDVIHCRISVSEEGFKFEEKLFPSLQAIVQSYPKLLKHPLIRTTQKPI